jgi:hypothetical protein
MIYFTIQERVFHRSKRPRCWECRLMLYTPKLELGSEKQTKENQSKSRNAIPKKEIDNATSIYNTNFIRKD